MATDGISITGDPDHRRVSVERDGQTLAAADVDSTGGPAVVHAVLHGEVRPLPGASGARLVDAEMVQQLRERTDDLTSRLAGGTVLVTAHPRPVPDLPPGSDPSDAAGR